jgi:cobalt-zinc-cadmium resistance protein CzcA
MSDALLRLIVQYRLLVAVLCLAVGGIGAWSLTRLPIDAVPDITNVQVQVNTEVAALAPLDIERQVTWPIETAMAGIPGLDGTRSISRNGFSQVTVVFRDGTDIYFARQQVAERLGQAREALPSGAEPNMGAISTGLGEVLMYTVAYQHPRGSGATPANAGQGGWQADGSYLTPEGHSLVSDVELASYLRTVQDWIIAPQLKQVGGVAGIDTIGGYERQYLVAPDPFKLASYGLSMHDLVAVLLANNQSAGGRFIERFGQSFVVRADGRVTSLGDIGSIVVANRGGTPIRISDVAEVAIGKELRTGSASRDGEESVVGTVLMLLGANSRTVAAEASVKLQAVRASLPADVVVEEVLNRQSLVDETIATVQANLVEGALLVTAVLFAMLGNLRGALIAALVIPLSLFLAAIGMVRYGISGNLMSLGAIDFGIIVDAAIIIVENCLRLLAERQHQLGRLLTLPERLQAVFQGAREMVQPVLSGQAIIITVFIPIVFLTGIEGKMFMPMGMTVIFALVASLLLSFTFVPALLALLCTKRVAEGDNIAIRWAKRAYAPSLGWALRWRWGVVSAGIALFVAAAVGFSRLGTEFVPTLDEGNIAMHAMRIPSTGISQSTAMQLQVEKAIRTVPEVAVAFSKTGTAEMASDPMPPNVSDTFIMLKPRSAWPDPTSSKAAVQERIAQAVGQIPGNNLEFTQPIQMRFNELISGVRSDVAVKVFGDDYAQLVPTAQAIAAVLTQVPGGADVKVEQVEGLPALAITIKREVIARLGLNVADVQDLISTAIGGVEAGVLFEGDRRFPLLVRLPEDLRSDPAKLRQLPIPLPEQAAPDDAGAARISGLARKGLPEPRFVPLGTIADLTFEDGLNQISRENGKRRVVVQANVRGRDLGGYVAEAQARIAHSVALPAGTWLNWGGTFENLKEARERLIIVVPAALALILFLLFSTFNSLKYAVLVFSGVPLALTGGVAALWLTGLPFSISAAVGFIALSGVAVLNGLVVVGHINLLRQQGRALTVAITEGALTKLRPMLMTALVGALGYVPMAIATGKGAEVQQPLAAVVIGGIISSALLTLYVLPALYRLCHRADAVGEVAEPAVTMPPHG